MSCQFTVPLATHQTHHHGERERIAASAQETRGTSIQRCRRTEGGGEEPLNYASRAQTADDALARVSWARSSGSLSCLG